MQYIPKAVVCAFILLAFTAIASGNPREIGCKPIPEALSKDLFDGLIGWIALNTSYDLLLAYRTPATVSFCDLDQSVVYEDSALIVEKGLLAAYDVTRRHIYLVRPWSPVSKFDQSVLLHEMIHDIQLSNRDWKCLGEPELEAYMLQDKWLVEHGIHHPFDWKMIFALSNCAPQ